MNNSKYANIIPATMVKKLSKVDVEKKSADINNLIDSIVNERIDIPDNAIILDPETMVKVCTTKKMELIHVIRYTKPKSIKELSDLVNRKKQAVDRDLKLLNKYDIISLKKMGRKVEPKIKKTLLLLNFSELYPVNFKSFSKDDEELTAQVFLDRNDVNKQLCTGVPE